MQYRLKKSKIWKLDHSLPLCIFIWMLYDITVSQENETKPKHTFTIKSPSSFTRLPSLCIVTQHAALKIFWEQPGLSEVSGKFEIVFRGARMKVSSPIDFRKTINCLRLCTNMNLQRSRALNNSAVCLQTNKNVLNLAATLAWVSNEIKCTISLCWTSLRAD